jgi:hypothetical protein
MVIRRDLARMKGGPRAAAWLAERAEPWLKHWEKDIGLPGFYPFDCGTVHPPSAAIPLREGLCVDR